MSYVLVSLVGDEATRELDILSQYIEQQRLPFAIFRDDNPSHEGVREEVDRLNSDSETASGVIFGHGGESSDSLRAYRDPRRVWSTPEQFADVFQNSRVYVFGCQTVSRPDDASIDSFGEEAVRHCVSVFVGHYMKIQPPEISASLSASQVQQLESATSAAILKFLDGCEDEGELKRVIQDSYDEEDVVFTTEVDDTFGSDGAKGWSNAALMQMLWKSLRVLRKESSDT